MKNEIVSYVSSAVLNAAGDCAMKLAKMGVRSVQKIPDALGNILKITTFKNHNIDIHIFMK